MLIEYDVVETLIDDDRSKLESREIDEAASEELTKSAKTSRLEARRK
jgi:hypothetical protein